jgi:hypothetical protein
MKIQEMFDAPGLTRYKVIIIKTAGTFWYQLADLTRITLLRELWRVGL